MKPFKLPVFFVLTALVVYASCKKEFSCEECLEAKKPPVANAGIDKTIILPLDSVTLDGSTSADPDGSIVSYAWVKINGPGSSIITTPGLSKTAAKNLVMGVYQFELNVKDNDGLSATDTVQIIVNDPAVNQPPIAKAGRDTIITLPRDSIMLDGSSSFDPDGSIVSAKWTKILTITTTLINQPDSLRTIAKFFSAGIYQFELKVTDNNGASAYDTVKVSVNTSASNNLPPIAIAGNDTIISNNQTSCNPVPISFSLNGSNSFDPDGTIVSYIWTGQGTISGANSPAATVNGSLSGPVSFILKVTDNNGASTYDTITITIIPANRPLVQTQLIPIGTLSQRRSNMAIGAANNKIVFAGGWPAPVSSVPSSTRVDIYDITSNTWTTKELSEARFDIGVTMLGDKIFFGGGGIQEDNGFGAWQYGGKRSSAIDIYDASLNTWSTAQLSSKRIPRGASAGNKLVFAGGDVNEGINYPSNAIDIYHGGTTSWTATSMTESKGLPQVAVAGNKIYLAGSAYALGISGSMSDRIDIYDASSGSWSVDFLSRKRAWIGAISTGNKIYWAGGYILNANQDEEATNSVEIRDLITNTVSFDCLSHPRGVVTIVKRNEKLLFFGGLYSKTTFDIYDLTTNSWSLGVLPFSIEGYSIISYNETVYIAGAVANNVLSNQVWKLNF